MNVTTIYDDSTASRCLSLIERHAARMMKVGGGALSGLRAKSSAVCVDKPRGITPEDVKKIIEVTRQCDTLEQVVRCFPWSESRIRFALRRAGEPTPFFRITGKRRGPPIGAKFKKMTAGRRLGK